MKQQALTIAMCLLLWAPVVDAQDAGGWFRSENNAVARGNSRMAHKDAKGALSAYDEAAKALPNAAGVHLNRGLALMAQGENDKARDALSMANQPPADKSLRAKAYYNLGNSFFKAADAAAKQDQHEDAQKLFREAEDAYKQSLRLAPGNADSAWNLQLASRRIREEEEKQDQQNQDQQNQDQQNQDQQNQDQQNQDQQNQDQQNQDQNKPPQDKPQQDKEQPQPAPSQQDKEQPQDQKPQARPSEAERALDALQDSEENLQQYRARQRALQERRRPDKDW